MRQGKRIFWMMEIYEREREEVGFISSSFRMHLYENGRERERESREQYVLIPPPFFSPFGPFSLFQFSVSRLCSLAKSFFWYFFYYYYRCCWVSLYLLGECVASSSCVFSRLSFFWRRIHRNQKEEEKERKKKIGGEGENLTTP